MSSLLFSDTENSSEDSCTNSDTKQVLDSSTQEIVPPSTLILHKECEILKVDTKPAKVAIRFSAIGSTSAVQPSAFIVTETQTVATISTFLKKKLGLQTVHLYVSNSFQPALDEKLGHLHGLFNTNGVLNFGYCESIAFG